MSNTEAALLVLLMVAVIGFCAMAAEYFRANDEWYKITKKQNEEWFELSLRQNKEWAEECGRLAKKCDELQARVNELEGSNT